MLQEKIISLFCLPESQVKRELEGETSNEARSDESRLKLLRHEFPHFEELVSGADVVDFGCGLGWQSLELARIGAKKVLGVDINETYLREAAEKKARVDPENLLPVEYCDIHDIGPDHKFDLVISQNAMEHYTNPQRVLEQMLSITKDDGKILITFGPPWYSPYGSHMHFFCKLPWLNILFSEKAIMSVRERYRDDGAERFEDVESGLNRMSLSKFENFCRTLGLVFSYRRYRGIKGLDSLSKIPVLRELFVNRVSVVIARGARAPGENVA
ncbi:methyltransferase family protein [Halospina denitrificans]|uniref:Methyltransferase family protein n=2 Tax=Halospina denitrificans TaxID=332522 RepID=A0A4R7JN12_9GAMM|nr:methyltransferase family protein [Halospina denitrificans]